MWQRLEKGWPDVVSCALLALCSTVLVGGILLPAAEAQQPYRVVDHWKVGGTGGWDYLLADPEAHLLYATHGPRVEVLDTRTGKIVGAITGLKGTHGVALDPDGKVGYTRTGDTKSGYATLQTLPTQKGARPWLMTPRRTRIP